MANKKQNNLLIGAGVAGVLAYLIFSKKQTPTQTPVQSTGISPGNVSTTLSTLKNLLFPPAANAPGTYNAQQIALQSPGLAQVDPATSPAAAVNTSTLQPTPLAFPPSPATDVMPPVDPSASTIDFAPVSSDQSMLSGFYPVPGTGLAIVGCCAAAAMMGQNSKNRNLGATKIDWQRLVVPAVLIGGGYFVLNKLGLFNKTGTTSNNQQTATSTAAGLQASLNTAKAQGDIQTIPDANLSSLANDIATKGLLSTPDQDGIQNDLIQVNTLTDLLKLKQYFGTRAANTGGPVSMCALFNINCDNLELDTFVKQTLDASHLNTVNGYLSAQNINYQF